MRRIGIDEISYKKGHRYITIVVDHDSGRLVRAAPGRDRKTLNAFFTALGEKRCATVTNERLRIPLLGLILVVSAYKVWGPRHG